MALTPREFDQYCHGLLVHLLTFRLVDQLGGVKPAAIELGVQPSTVSERLSMLRETLGNELLLEGGKRRGRHTTKLGKRYLQMADAILPHLEDFVKDFYHQQEVREVHIATINSAWFAYNDSINGAFRKYSRDGHLVPHLCRTAEEVPKLVAEGVCDLGIVSYLKRIRRPLLLHNWLREPMILAVAASNSHFKNRKNITVDDFRHNRFLGFTADMPIAKDISQYLERLKVAPLRPQFLSNVSEVMDAVAANTGISILPEPCLKRRKEDIKTYSLPEPLYRPLAVIYHRDAFEQSLLCNFLGHFGVSKPVAGQDRARPGSSS